MTSEFDKYKPKDDFKKYESLNNYLDKDKSDLNKKETFEMWEQLCENWGEVLGYDNKSKIFEFAIVESLNVPIASLGGYNHGGHDINND